MTTDVEDLRAFWDRCKHADWFYEWIDDGERYRAARATMQQMAADAKLTPERQAIYDAWHAHKFSGPHFGNEPKPEPVRP